MAHFSSSSNLTEQRISSRAAVEDLLASCAAGDAKGAKEALLSIESIGGELTHLTQLRAARALASWAGSVGCLDALCGVECAFGEAGWLGVGVYFWGLAGGGDVPSFDCLRRQGADPLELCHGVSLDAMAKALGRADIGAWLEGVRWARSAKVPETVDPRLVEACMSKLRRANLVGAARRSSRKFDGIGF